MVTTLTDDVWWVDLQGTNAFLVDDDGVLTLVDAGAPWHSSQLARALAQVGSVDEVDRVVVTHFDIDHVGGLGRLGGLDAPVYVGAADAPYLRGEERPPWSRKGLLQRALDVTRTTPDLPVEPLADGDTVGSFTAYHTPGHTPGHTAFVSEELSVGLLGDLVVESGGRYELPAWYLAYDDDEARASLGEFADRALDFEVACQGHGTPFLRRGAERVTEAARREGAASGEGANGAVPGSQV